MAWRDNKARATLIREAAGSLQPGKTPRPFAELLFDHTNIEDLANHDAISLAFLAEQAWEHVQRRTAGSADVRVVNPTMPDGREISVLEVLNDNMPFLVDSTMAELAEQGIEVTLVAHPIIAVERDEQGKLLRFYGETLPEGARGERESLIHFHIARLDADADRKKLIEGLTKTLNDVRACVTDWRAMRARVEQAIKTFSSNPPPLPIDEVAEANQFLQWLCADNFTFVGLREYRFLPDSDAPDDINTGVGLGILRDPDVKVLRRGTEMVVMTPEIREFIREPTVLMVVKANVSSRVHRRVRMDYVGIKLYMPDGRLEGELRVVGLFTSGAYTRSARQIPYVRHKVAQVLERAGFDPHSHSGKAVQHILEEYPRDELFQVDAETLYNFVMEILMLYERPRVRALARADKFDRFVSVLVFIPRDKYDTDVRTRVGTFLAEGYKGSLSASYASFPEGSLARVHYIIGRYEGATPVIARDRAGIRDRRHRRDLGRQAESRARHLHRRHAGPHARQSLRPCLHRRLHGGLRHLTGDRGYRDHRKAHPGASGGDFSTPHRGRGRSDALRPQSLLARSAPVAVLPGAGDRTSWAARGQRTDLSDRA